MSFLNILDNLRSKVPSIGRAAQYAKAEPNTLIHDSAGLATMETLYSDMIAVMDHLPQIRQQDFDHAALRMQLLLPIAHYLTQSPSQTRKQTGASFLKPLFVSGVPGIGKTTLLMVLDEVLDQLNRSCREMVISGKVSSYFVDKSILHVTPLTLFGKPTGVLSARDWNNLLRHWTYDETIADSNKTALDNFIQRLQGKVVIMDEAELEGYVYISELLAQHGILVILTSNLAQPQIHLPPDHVQVIALSGLDHRSGRLSKVCLPDQPHVLFDFFSDSASDVHSLHETKISPDGIVLAYFDWQNLERQPLMRDDFARLFMDSKADALLLDAVPFFTQSATKSIDLTFLGYLSRFVNFVDAVHDCGLPLLIRGTHRTLLDDQTAGSDLYPILMGYDQRVGGYNGEVAWIEWSRCLSRLRSREAINAQVWPPLEA